MSTSMVKMFVFDFQKRQKRKICSVQISINFFQNTEQYYRTTFMQDTHILS